MVKTTRRYYLAEWYSTDVTDQSVDDIAARLGAGVTGVCAEGASVQLLLTMMVPADEVLYCLFAADSPKTVVEVCQHAAMPPDRLTPDIAARMSSGPPQCADKHVATRNGEVVFAHFGPAL